MLQEPNLCAALFDHILGSFDLADTVAIFPKRHADLATLSSTIVHEEGHKHLAHITTMGWLQMICASLISEKAVKADSNMCQQLRRTLRHTINQSWFTHEGYATYREFFLGRALTFQTDETNLPHAYKEALAFGRRLELTLPVRLRSFALSYVQVVFETAMNIEIPPLDAEAVLRGEWVDAHFVHPDNQPDSRLVRICDALTEEPLEEGLWKALGDKIWTELHGLAPESTEDEIAHRFFSEVGPSGNPMRTVVVDCFTHFVEQAIRDRLPELMIIPATEAVKTALAHFDNLRLSLGAKGINLPARRVGTDAEKALSMENVEFIFANEFKSVSLPAREAGELLLKKVREGAKLCVQLTRFPNVDVPGFAPGVYIYGLDCVVLAPANSSVSLQKHRKAVTPEATRLTAFGSQEEVQMVLHSIAGDIAYFVVCPSCFDLQTWVIAPDVTGLIPCAIKPLIRIFPTTRASGVLHFLQAQNDELVKTIVWLGPPMGGLNYFAFELSVGGWYLLKISESLLGVLRFYYRDLHERLFRDLSAITHDKRYGQLILSFIMVARLEQRGAFAQ